MRRLSSLDGPSIRVVAIVRIMMASIRFDPSVPAERFSSDVNSSSMTEMEAIIRESDREWV
jgi:hypothetical protein